jgi:hypothetical protein
MCKIKKTVGLVPDPTFRGSFEKISLSSFPYFSMAMEKDASSFPCFLFFCARADRRRQN